MTTETYQGWTNRETWCVALWLNNEQGLQEGARDACNCDGEMLQEAAETLSRYVDDLIEDDENDPRGMMLDLINCALARCNFAEIASKFREEAA